MDGKAQFVYIDFAFLGQESVDASLAAHCAGDQNKFWEYHDLLFAAHTGENVGDFSRANLDKFAQQLNLNMDQFKQCVDSKKYADFVAADFVAALAAGALNARPADLRAVRRMGRALGPMPWSARTSASVCRASWARVLIPAPASARCAG